MLAPGAASAQVSTDPAAVVAMYSASLSDHDVLGALALFDQNYGSATDGQGHNFAGREALTAFLLGNGFTTPDAHLTTKRLTVVANRAIWIYSCTCAATETTVHMVLTAEGKISVFAMIPPAAAVPQTRAAADLTPWLVGLAALATGAAMWLFGSRNRRREPRPTRPLQGQLLSALRAAHCVSGQGLQPETPHPGA